MTYGYALLGRKPDVAIILSLPLETSQRRSESKDEPFPDPPETRAARHALYEELAKDPGVQALDAEASAEVIVNEIMKAVEAL